VRLKNIRGERRYLVVFDKDDIPLTWYKLEVGDYAEIAENLEIEP
jgi:hypothetical protein